MDTQSILEMASRDDVRFVLLQFSDIFGVVKSLTIPIRRLPDAFEHGVWFDGSSIEGFSRIAESDMYLKPDPSTYAVIPWLESPDGNTARFICNVYNANGTPFDGDPRLILERTIKKAEEMGFRYNTGPELEFFLFKKDNGQLRALPHDRGSYFDLTTDEAYTVRRDMTLALERFGIEVETSHHEVAPGQHEISFHYDNALKTADNAMTLRFVLKAIAQRNGLHATFMPKPIAGINGSGMHVHQSLSYTETWKNAFYDEMDTYKLSKTAYGFIAGQLEHIRAMSAILSPTVNSYKRLVPGYEAPVYISWARLNRSALIRVPQCFTGRTEATRVELRCPDPSSNIYLAFAVMLSAGLDGITKNMNAPEPVEENIYDFDEAKRNSYNIKSLPHSLAQALEELKKDLLIQETLGLHILDRYIEAKTNEYDQYRMQVTPWELERYLESY